MSKAARDAEIREVALAAKNASTPEQARDALVAMGNALGGNDRTKCNRFSQELGDERVVQTCHSVAGSLLKKVGGDKPWWKFW